MVFDLKKNNPSLLAEAGYEFELETETGEKTGMFFKVRGANSPAVKAHGRKIFQEMKLREQQAKRRGKEYELDLEEAEEMSAEAAAIRIIDWRGLVEDGKEVKFSKEEALRICTEYDWVRKQVQEQSDNVFNFSKS